VENNNKLKLILVAGLVLLLSGNALLMQRHMGAEWQNYQKEYLKKAIEKTTDPKLKEELKKRSPRIEQLILTDFGEKRVDRCVTCHTSINDQRFKNEENPYKAHPELPGNHSFGLFGCTVCHDGNGRGLTKKDAHGGMFDWMYPMLKGPYVQSSCGKCHSEPYLKETPILVKGSKLFKSLACYGCHKIDGVSKGSLGVPLTTVGHKRSVAFMLEKIKNPKQKDTPETVMPIMKFTEEQLTALVVYLKSKRGEYIDLSDMAFYEKQKIWKKPIPRRNYPVSVASGKQIYETKSCTTCHAINGVGGVVGPDLTTVGLRRNKKWQIQHLINPRNIVTDSIMPDFPYSKSELESLALYLETKKEISEDGKKAFEKKYLSKK
jgi:cbb3-type cytochrome oxidase cytochrome c subunit